MACPPVIEQVRITAQRGDATHAPAQTESVVAHGPPNSLHPATYLHPHCPGENDRQGTSGGSWCVSLRFLVARGPSVLPAHVAGWTEGNHEPGKTSLCFPVTEGRDLHGHNQQKDEKIGVLASKEKYSKDTTLAAQRRVFSCTKKNACKG